ncbi:LAQU0S04e01112g1_1 [Lachancea quebecensis]|uniref:LAQU0S04e01112g1_1 n=1 Tax=Lachancea quebecensis TaxID=1654605 RepID=A0A0P1KQ56_9SACH|nr:LAQU0S04e01112g1_1 [Lachancea quebecensis]
MKCLASVSTSVLLALALSQTVTGLYFYMKSGETKCFYEGLTRGSQLEGQFAVLVERDSIYERGAATELRISIDETFDNDYRVFDQRSTNGNFTITALETGEHRVCLELQAASSDISTQSDADEVFEVHVDFQHKHLRVWDSELLECLGSASGRVRNLNARLASLRVEQRIVKEEQISHDKQCKSVNTQLLFWSSFQLIVLVVMCAIQLRSLRGLFRKKTK